MRKKYAMFWSLELFIIFFLGIAYFFTKGTIFSKCFLHESFNILCPTCGGTRCVINFLQMNWKQSFENHPIFFLTIIYIMLINIVFLINCITGRENFRWIYPSWKKYAIYIFLLISFTIARNLL